MKTPSPNSTVNIAGFTGWGMAPTMVSGHIVPPAQIYRRQDGCYCNFAVDVTSHAGMSGSPILTIDGKVAGVVTTAGTGKFRGITFGTTLERAGAFLHEAGLASVASHTTGRHFVMSCRQCSRSPRARGHGTLPPDGSRLQDRPVLGLRT